MIRRSCALAMAILWPAKACAGEPLGAGDPPVGFAGDVAYLRTSDNSFVLLPSGRVQLDGHFFEHATGAMPDDSFP